MFPLPCHLVPLKPKYSPQHRVLKHPQPTFLPECDRPSFTPIQNTRQIYTSLDVRDAKHSTQLPITQLCFSHSRKQSSRNCNTILFRGYVMLRTQASSVILNASCRFSQQMLACSQGPYKSLAKMCGACQSAKKKMLIYRCDCEACSHVSYTVYVYSSLQRIRPSFYYTFQPLYSSTHI